MTSTYIILFLITGTMVFLWETLRGRSGKEVVEDMAAGAAEDVEAPVYRGVKKKRWTKAQVIPVVSFVVYFFILMHSGIARAAVISFLNSFLTYVFLKYKEGSKKALVERKIDYFLPLVMERLVMAVEVGLDIIPAIKSIVEIEKTCSKEKEMDPVTKLFEKVINLSESGLIFSKALEQVGTQSENPSLRHAFIHLGVAHRDGGEVVNPLRELSDATQLYYQESVEERIAKMPAKATGPLVIIFLGLVIFFLTTPLLNIVSFAKKNAVSGGDL